MYSFSQSINKVMILFFRKLSFFNAYALNSSFLTA